MKKTTLLAVMALLCLNFGLHAQTSITIPALRVGDKVPEMFWQSKAIFLTKEGKREEIALNTFKNRALLFDFWACWCGSCINHFRILNQIQANNPSLAIIPVNTKTTHDTDERIFQLLNGKKYAHVTLDMPSIVADTALNQFFPHRGIPYYVWISKEGIVRAITSSLLVNEVNLNLLLNAEK